MGQDLSRILQNPLQDMQMHAHIFLPTDANSKDPPVFRIHNSYDMDPPVFRTYL